MNRARLWLLTPLLGLLAIAASGCKVSGDDDDDNIITIISTSAVVNEIEPNDTAGAGQVLNLGQGGVGAITSGDVDYWAYDGSANALIRIELHAIRYDQTGWANNPVLTFYDTDGTTAVFTSDDPGLSNPLDPDIMTVRLPASGRYYLRVSSSGVETAAEYVVILHGAIAAIQVEAEPEFVTTDNDTAAEAEAITGSGYVVYGYCNGADTDYYSFSITAGDCAYFELQAYRNGKFGAAGDRLDAALTLYDTNGTTVLYTSDDVFFEDPALRYYFDTSGTYYIRVTRSAGTGFGYYFLSYAVSSATDMAEVEGNDSFGTADSIPDYNYLVTGNSALAGNDDYFSFTGTAGDMIRIHVLDGDTGQTHQGATDNVGVTVYNPSQAAMTVDRDQTGALDVVRTVLQVSGIHYVRITRDTADTDYAFLLERFRFSNFETEPNDSVGQAESVNSQGRASGLIGSGGDVDTFSFSADGNELVHIVLYGGTPAVEGVPSLDEWGSVLAPRLIVRNGSGTALANTVVTAGLSAQTLADGTTTLEISFVPPTDGTYYVEVSDSGGGFGSNYFYAIDVD